MGTPFVPVEVFYSFADADASLLEQLEHHLSVLRREGQITTWHKRQVTAGSDWQVELDQHLNTASLILLLISPDFLASDYQYGVELQRAVQRHDANEARVIPIALRACEWEGAPFQRFQVIPRNGKAITSWRNRDEAFAEIAREIRLALEAMQQLTVGAPFLALPKIWQIPYPRNPIFTGREDLLHTLTGLLQTDHAAVLSQWQTQAISGLGGIGKTQLAVEYAYRTAHQYQEVFWVRAETRETLVSGYTTLAEALHLREKDEQDQNRIIQAVRNWLQTHKGWLLILDNADDLSLVEPLLPPVYGGRILLTTRAHTTGRFAHCIEIDTLTNAEGALLLLRRAGMLSAQGVLNTVEEHEMVLARQISELLGNLPLALDQAGAYIEETGCSLLSYRQQYEKRRAVLLARRGQLATDHPDSVATTWSLSFEKVELASSIAAQVLRLCAFLAPDAIPEELLVQALISGALSMVQAPDEEKSFPAPMTEQEKEWESTHQAEKAWEIDEVGAILSAYSLMQRNPQEATIGVHRLVQTILRESMSEEERHMWAERTVRVVKETLPGIAFANWKRCEQYMPHAQECMQLVTERIVAEETQVLHWIGAYLLERQRTHEAGPYVQQALAFNEQHLGREHPKTAASLDRVARWLELQGKYAQAEPLYVRALTIFEQQLGVQHPDTASSLNNLALLYQKQEKDEQAEPLLMRALAICEQQLGAEHPDTARSLNNLASLYYEQGKYTQAEPLYVRVLAICEQQLGTQHPSTASSLNNLAMLYERQGKYEQAAPLYMRALAICEYILGPNHPNTQKARANYTTLLQAMGSDGDAKPREESC